MRVHVLRVVTQHFSIVIIASRWTVGSIPSFPDLIGLKKCSCKWECLLKLLVSESTSFTLFSG